MIEIAKGNTDYSLPRRRRVVNKNKVKLKIYSRDFLDVGWVGALGICCGLNDGNILGEKYLVKCCLVICLPSIGLLLCC